MPTVFTHAVTAVATGKLFYPRQMSRRFWLASVFCAVAPDLDVIGFQFGVHYNALLGHRGLTHSLVFALALSLIVVLTLFRRLPQTDTIRSQWRVRLIFVAYFFVVTASHGVLDAMTNGGLGVAFFAPFDATRYFFPWQPIQVSPIGATHFFSHYGLAVMLSELQWLWLPSLGLMLIAKLLRMR